MILRPTVPLKRRAAEGDVVACRPWNSPSPPRKILAIRLQALGDTVITLPYLQTLRTLLPSTQIDFLTREAFEDIPHNMAMFRRVYAIGGGRSTALQLVSALRLVPVLKDEGYDVVLDLQHNRVSRFVRAVLSPKSFSEFDRYSLASAGERTKRAIDALRLTSIGEGISPVRVKDERRGVELLAIAGAEASDDLIVLNPAGSFITRSWPIQNYVRFALLWRERVAPQARFLVLGTDGLMPKGKYLQERIVDGVINLAGKTTPSEAFNILKKVRLVLSEDSGLMHMAWVAGAPTLALFGSSLGIWSRPLGNASVCFSSSDLECGECLEPGCKWGDVRCLTRYSPEFVVEAAQRLLDT